MRAVVVREFGGPEAVLTIETDVPEPGPGQVRVRVAAAAVHPADAMNRMGLMTRFGAAAPSGQVGLGTDAAGTVDAVGPEVRTVAIGTQVIALRERIDEPLGAQAEYLVVEEWAVAPVPGGATMVEAATLPLNATTADQALDALNLRWGQWVLVTGAAGAVGGFAVELAVVRGLRVVATAVAEDERFVHDLGAELVVPRGESIGESVRRLVPGGVDGALDAANVAVAAMDAVRHGGAFVSLLNTAPQARRAITTTNLAYHCDGPRLAELSALAGAGRLTLRVSRTLPFEEAGTAQDELTKGGVRGQLVLVP